MFDEHTASVEAAGAATSGAGARLRKARERVAGEPPSPLVRAALAAHTASPLAHAGDADIQYINDDHTLRRSRLPLSDVMGLRSGAHISQEGVAVER